jgi:hypothetical protein
VRALISGAACGADLVALQVAEELGIRRRVVLAFERQRFRRTSVIDRPGAWGPLYDRIIKIADASGDLVELTGAPDDESSYIAANRVMLDEAERLADEADAAERLVAFLLWDRVDRGPADMTAQFGTEARARGFTVVEISTL